MKQKKTILYILLGLFALSLAYRVTHPYRQERVNRLIYSGSRRHVIVRENQEESHDRSAEAPQVMVALLSKAVRHHGKVIRDPFFKAPTENRTVAKPAAAKTKNPERSLKPAKEDPRLRVEQELRGFKVFGSYNGEGKHMLFLARGKDLLIVQQGDKIDGKYLVKTITKNSMDLWADGIQEDIRIDLSGF